MTVHSHLGCCQAIIAARGQGLFDWPYLAAVDLNFKGGPHQLQFASCMNQNCNLHDTSFRPSGSLNVFANETKHDCCHNNCRSGGAPAFACQPTIQSAAAPAATVDAAFLLSLQTHVTAVHHACCWANSRADAIDTRLLELGRVRCIFWDCLLRM